MIVIKAINGPKKTITKMQVKKGNFEKNTATTASFIISTKFDSMLGKVYHNSNRKRNKVIKDIWCHIYRRVPRDQIANDIERKEHQHSQTSTWNLFWVFRNYSLCIFFTFSLFGFFVYLESKLARRNTIDPPTRINRSLCEI